MLELMVKLIQTGFLCLDCFCGEAGTCMAGFKTKKKLSSDTKVDGCTNGLSLHSRWRANLLETGLEYQCIRMR